MTVGAEHTEQFPAGRSVVDQRATHDYITTYHRHRPIVPTGLTPEQTGIRWSGRFQGRPGETVRVLADRPDDLASFVGVAATPRELAEFLMVYRFAIDEVTTKLNILREEFNQVHDYNPIEHVKSRLKTPQSIVAKARRIGCPLDIAEIRGRIRDIAGVRVVCSFVHDVYAIFEMFVDQTDVEVIEVEDYIEQPKPNGYKSLHAIVRIPVFLSGGPQLVDVEMQFRTVAMDFWASLEHKIYYKYDRQVPIALLDELRDAADIAAGLDARMQRLHREINGEINGVAPGQLTRPASRTPSRRPNGR